ncbi:molybdopterin molybdochelatase [Halomicrobium zhouii]|uniref:Molybdopterin molybdochelatase n=1 Tax=Halomicrobium zhouii TaxID=767519 RepID=A0A1I6KAK2_9EURY|nr:gephyrin-like molybdotransferase Glp [Halomicrobium zhouii]SFR88239.1 molybdopterin molybdochelatase [Halomicrobium zhouii]
MTAVGERTAVDDARAALLDLITPVEETESLPVAEADDRIIATDIDAPRAVPHYDRAAMDGFAVRATDVVDAGERAPVRLALAECDDEEGDNEGDEAGGPGQAVSVDTGEAMPAGADAVVMVERTELVDGEVLVFEAVAPGENVGAEGEDVEAGARLFDVGHRLAPADLGLLQVVGLDAVDVFRRPRVVLIPTGEELVSADPDPGEVVESNSLTVGRYVERWGGDTERFEPVTDDSEALRAALREASEERDADLILTLGGTSAGERDRVPGAVESIGSVEGHGVALQPGHPVGFGTAGETPVVMLPGYPVGCLVAATALVRPAVSRLANRPLADLPTTEATLSRKLASPVGTRTYARVALDDGVATPIRARGSGVLSSVTEADGWVVVPEETEGFPEGHTVAVENWRAEQ